MAPLALRSSLCNTGSVACLKRAHFANVAKVKRVVGDVMGHVFLLGDLGSFPGACNLQQLRSPLTAVRM
jgi:hypothetical protein